MNRILLLGALCFGLVAPAGAAGPEINAALSVMGYGHSVKVLVNGADIGITGGKSQAMRLFNKGHPWAAKATPEMRARNFVLKPGENEVVIEFTREPKSKDRLNINLDAEGYPAPLLDITSTAGESGRYAFKLVFEPKAPQGFKPIVITDQK